MRGISSSGIALRAVGRFTLGALALGTVAIGATPASSAEEQVRLLPLPDHSKPRSPTLTEMKLQHVLSAGAQLQSAITQAGGPVTVTRSKVHGLKNEKGTDSREKNKHDTQVNDPALDHTQSFAGTFPFEFATQSESTVAADGKHVVASYNTSAGAHVVEFDTPAGPALGFDQILLSGYSVSHDWGRTWSSGFVAPPTGSIATYGDGVVAKDRKGSFYYSMLGLDADFNFGVFVGKSTDHGDTFAPAVTVALDNGGDKEWLAVGPSPTSPDKDNVYVTWTTFPTTTANGPLMFSRSTDAGATWSAPTAIYTPASTAEMAPYAVFSNPVVDPSNGRLYVPFLHAGWLDADFIRVLVSDDAGSTFKLLAFNVAGAPDIYAYPSVTPGTLADCGTFGGFRIVYKQGANIGGGRLGLERYVNCTRTINQPAAAASNGRLVIALNVSNSLLLNYAFDPNAGGSIVALHSNDGGATWLTPISVAPSTTNDLNHFHPAVALGQDGKKLFVGYYVQQKDEKLRTEIASFKLKKDSASDRDVQALSSVTFDLPPSVIPLPVAGDPYDTWHWDRLLAPGYSLGEYMGVTLDDEGKPMACWGECRNTWTSPSDALAPGTHPQADVFFRRVNND
jgi:hypothetical protein